MSRPMLFPAAMMSADNRRAEEFVFFNFPFGHTPAKQGNLKSVLCMRQFFFRVCLMCMYVFAYYKLKLALRPWCCEAMLRYV